MVQQLLFRSKEMRGDDPSDRALHYNHQSQHLKSETVVTVRRRLAPTVGRQFGLPTYLGSRIPLISLIQTLAVAEYLNFRHAANRLGVSQSSVSTRIKALEEDLGILLFERRHRGVRLTEAGRSFVAEVAAGIEHLDHAVKTAGAISTGTIGRLCIGLHTSIAAGLLADLRRKYREKYPDIELVIAEGRSDDTIRQVREGALDIAFVLGPVNTPDCNSRQIWTEAFVIAAPTSHQLAMADRVLWQDLASDAFLVSQSGAGPQIQDHIVRRIAEQGKTPNIRRFDVGRDTLMHMIADGEGITLTTEAATYVPFSGVAFRLLADETERARFSAVWSPHNRSPALMNFLDLADEMGKSAKHT
ncbi:LysR family transcriptional regulator [Brevundimonas mediterranea]|uniref:HTH-type transcriptional regulator GltC n=1 Tax=Brevundimonas mediterranea TaxID=74329 RepID=A0A7Z8Y2R1_9CAUL|nr:LysR family transcriptional regulator [Brevundimonas mediterranea]VDC49836.1 HTH-type transcriptional regulator GltC [Brevundimonas mediterranea]